MTEQFLDGVYQMPLVRSGSREVVGTAVVTFENGQLNTELKLSQFEAKKLGIELAVVHALPSIYNADMVLVAGPLHDEEW